MFFKIFQDITIFFEKHYVSFPVVGYISHDSLRRQTHMYFVGKTKKDEKTSRKWQNPWSSKRQCLVLLSFSGDCEWNEKFRVCVIPSGFRFGVSWLGDDAVVRAWPWEDRRGIFLAKHWSSWWNKYGKARSTFLYCSGDIFAAHFKKTINFQIFMFMPHVLIMPHSLWYYILGK